MAGAALQPNGSSVAAVSARTATAATKPVSKMPVNPIRTAMVRVIGRDGAKSPYPIVKPVMNAKYIPLPSDHPSTRATTIPSATLTAIRPDKIGQITSSSRQSTRKKRRLSSRELVTLRRAWR